MPPPVVESNSHLQPARIQPIAIRQESPRFPSTRFQGSKRRLAAGIVERVRSLEFTTVLDAFGGTGAVSHAFKAAGKHVTYNDVLAFNQQIGTALIENDSVRLTEDNFEAVERRHPGVVYNDFIARTFDGIYFTREENEWLDVAAGNIRRVADPYRRAMAWYALFQSALAKRPYNLFHRKNLYMRLADVSRGFGNKASWDRPFEDHFRFFAAKANQALIDGGGRCRAIRGDVLSAPDSFDLVYIDPPYMNRKGQGVDYQQFYHFLEGLMHHGEWAGRIDWSRAHRPLRSEPQYWSDPRVVANAFRDVFEKFRSSILVVSYRSDGFPEIETLTALLQSLKHRVEVHVQPERSYALSTNRRSREVLWIARD